MSYLQSVHATAILKEYEIVMLIYNEKQSMLHLLCFGASMDIILQAIQAGTTKFEGKTCLNNYKLIS